MGDITVCTDFTRLDLQKATPKYRKFRWQKRLYRRLARERKIDNFRRNNRMFHRCHFESGSDRIKSAFCIWERYFTLATPSGAGDPADFLSVGRGQAQARSKRNIFYRKQSVELLVSFCRSCHL